MGRREDLVEAAVLVVADGGLKGLTHRAVDARAGLPSGSAANVFHDRGSLIRAILSELERLDRGFFGEFADSVPRQAAELARILAVGVAQMTSATHAPLTRARLTMSLAYSDDVRPGHVRLLDVLVRAMAGCGLSQSAERAPLIAAFLDGVLLHALTVSRAPLEVDALAEAIGALMHEETPARDSAASPLPEPAGLVDESDITVQVTACE